MPRVLLSKKKYKGTDLVAYIVGEMYTRDLSQSDIAKELGITQQAFSYRLKNHLFTYEDLLTLFQILETPNDKILEMMRL